MAARMAQNARQMTSDALPELNRGQQYTTSSALKRWRFNGKYSEWPDFNPSALQAFRSHRWRGYVLKHRAVPPPPTPLHYLSTEKVVVGEEHGVQGRLNEHVGHVMSGVLESQGIDLVQGDFGCANSNYAKIPDFVFMSAQGEPKISGETKTPCVGAHDLDEIGRDDDKTRRLLAQPALYMQELQLTYGIITTYRKTVFLRQAWRDGEWRLEYSPVVHFDAAGGSTPSVRQALWYIAGLADGNHRAVNLTPGWISQ